MITKSIIVLWTIYCGYSLLAGLGNIGRQPGLIDTSGGQIAASIGIVSWFFIWAVVVVPVALIGLLFKRAQTPAQDVTPWEKTDVTPSIASWPSGDVCQSCHNRIPANACGRCPTCGTSIKHLPATGRLLPR